MQLLSQMRGHSTFIVVWTGAWFHESKWTPKSGSLMEQLVGRNCDKILQNEIEELIQGYYTMASMQGWDSTSQNMCIPLSFISCHAHIPFTSLAYNWLNVGRMCITACMHACMHTSIPTPNDINSCHRIYIDRSKKEMPRFRLSWHN